MKVKRFNNLWTMGLILFGALLIVFYIAKIFFPQFVVGVAEVPSIVKFGTYVDTHKWAYYLFYTVTSSLTLYLYICAVCRTTKLTIIESLMVLMFVIIYFFIEEFFYNQAFTYNICLYFILTLIVCKIRNIKDYKVLYSFCICFLITAFAQSLSLEIRDISTLISYPNSATFFILIIDGTIWHILLYLYFNYKGEKTNG